MSFECGECGDHSYTVICKYCRQKNNKNKDLCDVCGHQGNEYTDGELRAHKLCLKTPCTCRHNGSKRIGIIGCSKHGRFDSLGIRDLKKPEILSFLPISKPQIFDWSSLHGKKLEIFVGVDVADDTSKSCEVTIGKDEKGKLYVLNTRFI